MADLGGLALLLVLVLSGFATLSGALGGMLARPALVRSGERALVAAWLMTLAAMGALWTLLLRSDFRVQYVWSHSNRDLPVFYKVAALWAGQEGSLLLWEFVVLSFGVAAVWLNRDRNRALMPYVVAVVASSGCFFALVNNFVANPFTEIALVHPGGVVHALPAAGLPADGRGLNPILQHPVMAVHPPVLYLGYIGFILPYAFCVAALITRRLSDGWIKTTRRMTLFTWAFLGAGILLGGRWAYIELGWGGYWAWDPVENASLLPWIVGTAFLHSVMIQEKRGMLKVWNVILVLMTYSLSIFGTFTTRSGIMSSVHAFASSSIGGWFVGYIALMVIGTAYLLITRLPDLKSENRFESMVSREASFLFNNLLFLAATFSIFLGTMWPVLSEALKGEKEMVGPPFFNRIETPLGLGLLFLMGVGPVIAWRKSSPQGLYRNFALPLALGFVTALGLAAAGIRNVMALVSFGLCAFVVATIAGEFWRGGRTRARALGVGFFPGLYDLCRRNTRRYGGYAVHFAMVLLFLGFTGKAFDTETKVPVRDGDVVSIRGYDLRVEKLVEGDDSNPNYRADRMTVRLSRDGRELATLTPEARFYHASEQLTTEVSRWGSFREDVYTVFVRTGRDGPAELQVFVNPLVRLVWLGGMLMFAGTLLCMLPDRRVRVTSPARTGADAAFASEHARA